MHNLWHLQLHHVVMAIGIDDFKRGNRCIHEEREVLSVAISHDVKIELLYPETICSI